MKKINIACVIDDDEIYTFTIKRIITNADIADKTLFFHNGKVALDFFTEFMGITTCLPDLILLDLNMPVLDGWQFMDGFIKLLPHIDKKITVYIVSSSIDDADINRAREMEQISDYIIKPITADKLKEIVAELN